jgi:hypothetical protein
MVLDMPLDPVDAAIWRIHAECTLRAAPLDAILAKIACKPIVHDAPAPLTTTLPHPMAMCGHGPFYNGGGALARSPLFLYHCLNFHLQSTAKPRWYIDMPELVVALVDTTVLACLVLLMKS